MISDLDRLSESRPLPFLHALLHEVKPTSEAGPLGEQANTGLSLCLGPWRYARKENRGESCLFNKNLHQSFLRKVDRHTCNCAGGDTHSH